MIIKGHPPYSNTYIITRFDQAIIIDPSFNYDEILSKVEGLNVVAILLTHPHSSHMYLIGEFNCPVYIHRNDYNVFKSDELNGFNKAKHPKPFKTDEIFIKFLDDNSKISIADKHIEVIHTPGHTDGSVCYKYENMLFTGDTLSMLGVGKIKRIKGASARMRRSIRKIFTNIPNHYTIYPGHGESGLLSELKNNKRIENMIK